ncbi:MAG: nucleoside hydrolase [Treponema sp.]|jgi:pyrimidine-specific ribonucleoside hydrolase|nr:nucleoside hydrolase [Treponema sp.]
MRKLPVIFDCDPGHDDAIALILAFASAKLDIRGVTVTGGNTTLEKALNNAKKILGFIGRRPPLAAGAARPMFRDLVTAPQIHGESGLDGPFLPLPDYQEEPVPAVELMRRLITESAEPFTIIATGPLTNLGILFTAFPEVKNNIAQISFMGGSLGPGNWTAAAEFNIFVDPEAADIVFSSGLPLIMSPLDVTQKALIMRDEIETLRAFGGGAPVLTAELLDFYFQSYLKRGFPGAALHDPCAVACLTNPELFTSRPCHLVVETRGIHTAGMTLGDLRPWSEAAPNVTVNTDIDRPGFIKLLTEACGSYGI